MAVQNKLKELIFEKQAREKREVSVDEIARACNMTRQNVHRWLNNEVKMFPGETISAFCNYLPCRLSDLLVLADEKPAEARP
jgi:DNA-binding Xre family transcriptional regulator